VVLDMGKLDQALAKAAEVVLDMGRSNQDSRIFDWVEKDIYTVGQEEGSCIAGQEVGKGICIVDQAQDSRTVSMYILTDLPADTICLEHNRHMQY